LLPLECSFDGRSQTLESRKLLGDQRGGSGHGTETSMGCTMSCASARGQKSWEVERGRGGEAGGFDEVTGGEERMEGRFG
jgi:hypothetical protein